MESRLGEGDVVEATPALFDALDEDLDHIAFVLDALRGGQVDVPLPWVAARARDEAAGARSCARRCRCGVRRGRGCTCGAVRAGTCGRTSGGGAAGGAPAASGDASRHRCACRGPCRGTARARSRRPRAAARARRRIDRLVNEAGEVAIARARVEGELRVAEVEPPRAHEQRDPPALADARDRDPGRVADPVAVDAASTPPTSIRSNSTATRASRSSRARWPKASTTSPRCSSRC